MLIGCKADAISALFQLRIMTYLSIVCYGIFPPSMLLIVLDCFPYRKQDRVEYKGCKHSTIYVVSLKYV